MAKTEQLNEFEKALLYLLLFCFSTCGGLVGYAVTESTKNAPLVIGMTLFGFGMVWFFGWLATRLG